LKKANIMGDMLVKYLGRDILSLEAISRFEDMDALKNWLKNTIGSIIELLENQKKGMQTDLFDEIKAFITENYRMDISLSTISERFYISPFYFCQVFKKRTGQTFLGYITAIRMQKARELLSTSNQMIYEIAEAVGFQNPKYFSRVFEKSSGCKPSEYRSKLHGRTETR
jgi:two-component system response regulator YesN